MKRGFAVLAACIGVAGTSNAQQSMAAFTPAQRAEVQAVLKKNPNLVFMSSKDFANEDGDELKHARDAVKKGFTPYLVKRDLNKDKYADFAVLLGEKDSADYARLIIFNGTAKGGYRMAFNERVEFSFNTALDVRSGLCLGEYRLSASMCIKPKGQGYESVQMW